MARKRRRTRKTNGAGSITKLSGYRNKPWMVRSPAEIQIDGSTKRKVIGYYATSEDAEMALAKYKMSPYNLDEKDTTLDELFEIWIEDKKSKVEHKRSWQRYVSVYNKYLSLKKNKPIRSFTYRELQDIVSIPPLNMSKLLRLLLNGVYDLAMKNNIVDKDISKLLEINHTPSYTREKGVFSRETIKQIREYSITSTNQNLKIIADMTLILLYTGMRAGEIRSIKKENVFLNKNYMIGGIKTEAGKDRVIPIHENVKDIINHYYNLNPDKDYLFPQKFNNKPFSESIFMRDYLLFREELGFSQNRHATRHTFISELQRLGVTESKIKRIVGHSTTDVTDGVYTHYEPKDLIVEVKKINYENI